MAGVIGDPSKSYLPLHKVVEGGVYLDATGRMYKVLRNPRDEDGVSIVLQRLLKNGSASKAPPFLSVYGVRCFFTERVGPIASSAATSDTKGVWTVKAGRGLCLDGQHVATLQRPDQCPLSPAQFDAFTREVAEMLTAVYVSRNSNTP